VKGSMRMWRLIPVATVVLLAVRMTTPAPPEFARAATHSVWTTSSMIRVSQTEQPGSRSFVNIYAARGEYEPFQVIVTAGDAALSGVDVSMSDLSGPNGAIIPAAATELFREVYVPVTTSSPDPGYGNRPEGTGPYPDALIPFLDPGTGRRLRGRNAAVPFAVAPYRNQPVWADLHVPADAPPGTYTGSVTVLAGGEHRVVPVSVTVWNFELPLRPTLKSSFGLHQPNLSDRRIHELLLRHRLMPESVNPADARELQQQFGLNATALRFWGNSDRKTCTMDPPPDAASIAAVASLYPPDLPLHMYPADEIDPCPNLFRTVRDWAATMRFADPRIKNLVTVSPQADLLDDREPDSRSVVDIWTLLPKAWEVARPQILAAQAKGDEVWSYTALVQDAYSPKWEIDFAPINFRIQPGLLSQSLSLTGILYWRVDLWTRSPWTDVTGYAIDGYRYPGEGMLIYPRAPPGVRSVVPSMRLKWIREGVEDFEYVAILKRLGHEAWALRTARRAAEDWTNWTRDPEVLESVRRELGNEIERLMSPADPPLAGR